MIIRLVCYDISNDSCRTRIYNKLEHFGFIPIQRSVFCGKHPPHHWETCIAALHRLLVQYGDPAKDKIFAVVISKNCAKKILNIGAKTDIYALLKEEKTAWI